jgi:2-oxoisovalerate dehydrogenase E2 component (dihydrolipoyl transacylase)
MGVYHVRLPDVGEGIAEAELVSWLVSVGDLVTQESALAEVLTDKATVEISSPVEGTVVYLKGTEGEVIAIGTEFVGIEIEGDAPASQGSKQSAPESAAPDVSVTPSDIAASDSAPTDGQAPDSAATDGQAADSQATVDAATAVESAVPTSESPGAAVAAQVVPAHGRAVAAPAVRRRAAELGVELATVMGSGPEGRVLHSDLDRVIAGSGISPASSGGVREIPIIGLRRRISQRMGEAWSDIPHITYVDEIDATELETLRKALNHQRPDHHRAGGRRLTLLPFIAKAIVLACADSPEVNAHFDSASGVLTVFSAVHIGIATQTPGGLVVPVVRNVESRGLWDSAAEISRLATAARDGKATAEELSGSTITITSLGAMGGLMTTPIINRPEVAIVGVNAMVVRPVWRDGTFVPRSMFNLSSSFDHRIVDGWVAATFVQRIKALLETPALLFTNSES